MKKVLPYCLSENLTEYQSIDAIPATFRDSTHQLWRLQKGSSADQENHFLKICNHTESPFWQVMQGLFDFDLRAEIAGFSATYALIDKAVSLKVPTLIQAARFDGSPYEKNTATKNATTYNGMVNSAYILTSEVKGNAVTSVNHQMIRQLAMHLAELHVNSSDTWGALSGPKFECCEWSSRLAVTLIECTKKWGAVLSSPAVAQSDRYLRQALEACVLLNSIDFVPMMPDLRWDQFLQIDNTLTALLDLDAFVFAPRELDFVILEYILSPDQIQVFSEKYLTHHVIPEISQVRPVYRLLLFYMQILGQTDLAVWMNRETVF